MKTIQSANTEGVMWNRLFRPERGDMPPEVAQFFLKMSFEQSDLDRMHDLAIRNQEGALSFDEQEELRSYRRVGLQLDLLRAKARLSLKKGTNGK